MNPPHLLDLCGMVLIIVVQIMHCLQRCMTSGPMTQMFGQEDSRKLLSFAFNLSHTTFSHSNVPHLWSVISHPILDGFSLNIKLYIFLYVILMSDIQHSQILSCFQVMFLDSWDDFVNQTALANAEHHRMSWYFECTSFCTIFRCSETFV